MLVALVARGPVTALILLGVVLPVQQVEGHILQPFLLGRAVKVHPLAIVFGIATGTLLAGIIGALLAVPIVAVIATVSGYLIGGEGLVPPEAPARRPRRRHGPRRLTHRHRTKGSHFCPARVGTRPSAGRCRPG